MVKRHRRGLVILALGALCVGILGVGALYRSRGVPEQLHILFQAVAALSERSQEHDEQIQMIVDHIGDLKASLCEFHGAGSSPDFCGPGGPTSDCVPGICDIEIPTHPCDAFPPPPGCDSGG